MLKTKIFLFCSVLLLLSSVRASSMELKELMGNYVEGKTTKEEFLEYVKRTNFPTDVRDVDIVTNKYGVETLRWFFSFTTEEVMRNVASIAPKKFRFEDLDQILEDYKKEKVSKEEVLTFLKVIQFPYDVSDLELITNHAQVRDIRWVIGSRQDGSREIASVAKMETIVTTEEASFFSKHKLVLDVSYGQEEVSTSSENLKYNSLRAAAQMNMKINETYSILARIGMSQFQNLKYSKSSDKKSSSSTSPEFALGLFRKSYSFHSLFGYDAKQSFMIQENDSTALAEKQFLHRAFYEGVYYFSDRISLSANVGYIFYSSGSESLSGLDYGVSAFYRLGSRGNYIIGLHHRRNQISGKSDTEFKNSVSSVSLGYAF